VSDHIPAPEDAGDQPGREPDGNDGNDAEEFAKMEAVMRASEKHREGGIDPELEVPADDSSPDT
jgi:hypothetical protein